MAHESTETTLADYLHVLKRRRVLVALVALVCAGTALGLSLLQRPSYEARTSLEVRDPNQDLTLLGAAFASPQTPLSLASAHLPQIERQQVLLAVKRDLHDQLSVTAIRSTIVVGVDPNSFAVNVTAQSPVASQAAAIANAVAQEDARLTTTATRAGYAQQAKTLARKLSRLGSAQDATTKAIYVDQLSRLQSLSSVATPVQVSSTAGVPITPTSPKPLRNTIAALAFGLLLGIALAYVRDVLDRRLHHLSEVEQVLQSPVVGRIRPEALGHAGNAKNGSGSLAAEDQESFRILRQNVRFLSTADSVRTILVTSPMAQEGKSTVAACLAIANAAAGLRTLLVECDLRRPVFAARFGLADKPGLTDYLTGNADPQEIIQFVEATPPGGNELAPGENGSSRIPIEPQRLACITSGTPPPLPAELLASERFRTFLAEVSQVYDSVILDSAPLLPVADSLEIVPHVAGVLICVRLEQTTRDQARAAHIALGRMPDRPTAVVLTAVREADEGYYGYYGANTTVASGAEG